MYVNSFTQSYAPWKNCAVFDSSSLCLLFIHIERVRPGMCACFVVGISKFENTVQSASQFQNWTLKKKGSSAVIIVKLKEAIYLKWWLQSLMSPLLVQMLAKHCLDIISGNWNMKNELDIKSKLTGDAIKF